MYALLKVYLIVTRRSLYLDLYRQNCHRRNDHRTWHIYNATMHKVQNCFWSFRKTGFCVWKTNWISADFNAFSRQKGISAQLILNRGQHSSPLVHIKEKCRRLFISSDFLRILHPLFDFAKNYFLILMASLKIWNFNSSRF